MTSFFPHSNLRPSTISISCLTSKAAGSTPRSGTLAPEPVDRMGLSIMTKSSAEAIGPSAPRATPSVSAMMRVVGPPRPLIISPSAPLRRMITVSGDPDTVMACRNPFAIDKTATKTATTPAIPKTAAAVDPLREKTVIRLNVESEKTCRSQLIGPVMGYNLLSASAMRSRPASIAGRMPAARPSAKTSTTPSTMSRGGK